MRIATWNVNSLKARLDKVRWWLERAKPDVLLMQETKLADADAPADEFAADSLQVFDDELDSFDRTRLAQRQALADHHRAGRAGRGHLHNPHCLARADIVVEAEADLAGVEVLRGIDIADGDGNDLELHVHEALR